MESGGSSFLFELEFSHLSKLAREAVPGLGRIDLFGLEYGREEKAFFSDPPGEDIPEGMRRRLQAAAGETGAAGEGELFFVQLRLPGQRPLGALCFHRECGVWTEENRAQLENMATVYAYALRSDRERREAAMQSWVWTHMVDGTDTCIYVTDPETDEILFMNRAMKRDFGVDHPEGQACWKVLQSGQATRCAFCPVQNLKEGEAYTWEEHNPVTGRIYENCDSLSRWTDGRLVHIQHSTDVTETRRLYKAAMNDELTGALSRLAGKEALARLLEEYGTEEKPLCVCMLDVNDLKGVNDKYGHAAGDELLVQVAGGLRRLLQGREFLMRLSGDEFVAVLPGARQAKAAERMEQALALLDRERTGVFPEGAAFCYGVVEVRERMSLRDVLARADERMYQQKRTRHIRQAEALLREEKGGEAVSAFDYDSSRLYDALISSTDDYIYVCNMKTGVFRYPPAMVAEFGLPGEIIPNAAAVWGAKVHPHDKRIFLESNQEITDGRTDIHCVEYRAQNVRGEWLWLRCRGYLERDENGEPALFAGFITNLGKKNKLDPLTGLFNKFELENAVMAALDPGGPRPLTYLMLGMDGLKRINSLYDRVFGDEVIRITAQRLRSLLPPNADVYRLDGDEFAILIRGDSRAAAEQLFCRIRETFDEQQTFDGRKFYCTLSCGCTFAPGDGSSYVELARCASYALDCAKRKGKNRLECYNTGLVAERRRTLELTELLRESVEHGFQGFQMYYQPIFTAARRLAGAEALARWRCDPYGAVGPDEFIPLLEQSGLILPVGRWIFREVLRTCARWQKRMPGFDMSLNLSYRQLEDESFYAFMMETLEKTGADPRHIILELTESYLAANMAQVSQRLTGIRNRGVRVAMDDFGTGYSSLGVLKTAPIDIAKIDRAFVRGIQNSPFDSTFLRLVVELCGVRGIGTCLEGVETAEEFETVRPMDLDYIQGFLMGRPIPAEEFEQKFLVRE